MVQSIALNKLKKILVETKSLKPITTDTGQVILSQAQIDKRVSQIKSVITIMEKRLFL